MENKKRIKQVSFMVIVNDMEMVIDKDGIVCPLHMAYWVDGLLAEKPEPVRTYHPILDREIFQKRNDILNNARKMEEKFTTLRERQKKLLVAKQ